MTQLGQRAAGIRVAGGGIRGGHYHSQSPESLFIHVAGLKVVCPSNPYDAKGLFKAAVRDDNPCVIFEHKISYRKVKGHVPEDDYVIPLGVGRSGAAGGKSSAMRAAVPRGEIGW